MKKLLNYSLLMLLFSFIAFACSKEDGDVGPSASLMTENTKNATPVGGYLVSEFKYENNIVSFIIELADKKKPQGFGLSHIGLGFNYCPQSGEVSNIEDVKIQPAGGTAIDLEDIKFTPGNGTGCDTDVDNYASYFKIDEINIDLGKIKWTVSFTLVNDDDDNIALEDLTIWFKTGKGCESITKEFKCEEIKNGCTFTQGYWSNHGPGECKTGNKPGSNPPNMWKVTSMKLGAHTYSDLELCAIFNTPVGGNGLISLAHQLIAAKLNIANGASGASIEDAIDDANALIGNLTIPPHGDGYLDPSITDAVKDILDDYNNGRLDGGPSHCDKEVIEE